MYVTLAGRVCQCYWVCVLSWSDSWMTFGRLSSSRWLVIEWESPRVAALVYIFSSNHWPLWNTISSLSFPFDTHPSLTFQDPDDSQRTQLYYAISLRLSWSVVVLLTLSDSFCVIASVCSLSGAVVPLSWSGFVCPIHIGLHAVLLLQNFYVGNRR